MGKLLNLQPVKIHFLINFKVARNPPGFAFVEYEDNRDAEDAVRNLDGSRACGSRIRVEMSNGRTRNEHERNSSRGGSDRRNGDRRTGGRNRFEQLLLTYFLVLLTHNSHKFNQKIERNLSEIHLEFY